MSCDRRGRPDATGSDCVSSWAGSSAGREGGGLPTHPSDKEDDGQEQQLTEVQAEAGRRAAARPSAYTQGATAYPGYSGPHSDLPDTDAELVQVCIRVAPPAVRLSLLPVRLQAASRESHASVATHSGYCCRHRAVPGR